ncbi:fumarylacetoacetate hydrolase [Salix suchowensis]|nr:fumarylacetoacetate hydrolase [Salix suchowensis]
MCPKGLGDTATPSFITGLSALGVHRKVGHFLRFPENISSLFMPSKHAQIHTEPIKLIGLMEASLTGGNGIKILVYIQPSEGETRNANTLTYNGTNFDFGLAFHEGKVIKAYEVVGSALDPSSQVSRNVLTVKHLLSPLANEEIKIVRCLGLNYADHAGLSHRNHPRVVQPAKDHLPDYEVELVIVIGKPAKDVSEEDALEYVLGYTGANDVSFRYHQMAVSQWGFSKSFDNTNPLGPCLVSAKSIPDPQNIPSDVW